MKVYSRCYARFKCFSLNTMYLNSFKVMLPIFYHLVHPTCCVYLETHRLISSSLKDTAPDSQWLSTSVLGDFSVFLEFLPVSWIFNFTAFSATMTWSFSPLQLPSFLYIVITNDYTASIGSVSSIPFSELHIVSLWFSLSGTPTPASYLNPSVFTFPPHSDLDSTIHHYYYYFVHALTSLIIANPLWICTGITGIKATGEVNTCWFILLQIHDYKLYYFFTGILLYFPQSILSLPLFRGIFHIFLSLLNIQHPFCYPFSELWPD